MYKYILLFFLVSSLSYSQEIYLENTEYAYDNFNRLILVTQEDVATYGYVYDNLGNRIQINIEPILGIDEEVLSNTITVYPNPTSNNLNILLPENISSEDSEITLFDLNGRLITIKQYSQTERNLVLQVDNISNGVYLLKVENQSQLWSQLFIKK